MSYFVLGNPLEALVYSKMSLKVHVAKENIEKYEFIANLINEKSDDYFKVILVSNGNKVELVPEELNHLAAILHFYAGGLIFMK